jgi:UDP-N-acetylglucosamine--N-acetylmuramyl-(pentapeptide) pyrophosphoryl-undecaprenol N-acetylglucosamine transferase
VPVSVAVDAPLAAAADNQLLWLGSVDGMEQELVTRAGIAYAGIHTGKIRGANPVRALRSGGKMVVGVRESLAIIDRFAPNVCLVTGGYVCAPVVLACRLRHVPVVIYLPDMTPGWSIKRMSRFAERVAVSFPAAAEHFGGEAPDGKGVVTGYPVRQELVDAAQDRQASRHQLAAALNRPLDAAGETPLILIWGGSQGSRNINQVTWAALPDLLPQAHVLHAVGVRDWPLYEAFAQASPLPVKVADRYHPVPYLHEEMTLALAAADLTVARAGASTLGEFPVAGLPSVLVPLPIAGVNQQSNAQQLVAAGAAVVIDDEALGEDLLPTLQALLADAEGLQSMRAAARALAKPEAAATIGSVLADVAAK